MIKRCTKCGIEKNLEEFHLRKLSKDGYAPVCMNCVRDYRDKYRDRINKQKRKYHAENKDRINGQRKKSYIHKPRAPKKTEDEIIISNRESRKKYSEKNRDKIKVYSKDYYKKYSAKKLAYSRQHHKRTSILLNDVYVIRLLKKPAKIALVKSNGRCGMPSIRRNRRCGGEDRLKN